MKIAPACSSAAGGLAAGCGAASGWGSAARFSSTGVRSAPTAIASPTVRTSAGTLLAFEEKRISGAACCHHVGHIELVTRRLDHRTDTAGDVLRLPY